MSTWLEKVLEYWFYFGNRWILQARCCCDIFYWFPLFVVFLSCLQSVITSDMLAIPDTYWFFMGHCFMLLRQLLTFGRRDRKLTNNKWEWQKKHVTDKGNGGGCFPAGYMYLSTNLRHLCFIIWILCMLLPHYMFTALHLSDNFSYTLHIKVYIPFNLK